MQTTNNPIRPIARRRGFVNRAIAALLASFAVLVLLSLLLSRSGPVPASSNEITVYCAAGLREPMEAIRVAYKKDHHVLLTIQYGGSSTLLANLEAAKPPFVFLPADESYIDPALAKGLVKETFAIAQMRPILAVKKGNPLQIKSLDDLLAKDVRISMTDPSAAATGKLVETALQKAGKWEVFKPRVTVFKGTVSEVAADLKVDAVDAAIIWDAMLKQLPDFEEAPLAELSGVTANVVAGVAAQQPEHTPSAHELAKFLAAPDKGQRFFLGAGFAPPASAELAR